jgi:MFS family permease
MPEPRESAAPDGVFDQARRALEGLEGGGMAVLPEAGKLLQDAAPGLASIIASSGVRAQLDVHRRCSAEAPMQQKMLFREATTANLCLLAAGVLSALVLIGPSVSDRLGADRLRQLALVISFVTLALGAAAAMFSYRARESDRLRRWLTMRGAAEVARLEAFKAICAAAVGAGSATAMAAFALTVRYLFDDQHRWLAERAASHRRSSDLTNLWGGLATALAFVGGSGALVAGFVPDRSWIAIAGVAGAAVMAYALSREGLRRDRANADRYEKAAVALDQLAVRVDPIAAEIAAGRTEALPAFVGAVAGLLESEHKQWLDGTAQAEATLAALDARLKELGGPKPATARVPTLVHQAESER